MVIVIAPDSFKGSLDAVQAASAMRKGAWQVFAGQGHEISLLPMADGGEGTLDVIVAASRGSTREVSSVDALLRPVRCAYGILLDGTAVIELAQASGILHIEPQNRTPVNSSRASTYGTGLVIRRAILDGAVNICLTLGGSATTDGGFGMLAALGANYFDAGNQQIDGRDANQLTYLSRVDVSAVQRLLLNIKISIACDVDCTLCGSSGGAHLFGTQKGLDNASIRRRDGELRQFAQHLTEATQRYSLGEVLKKQGLGAAGGAGLGLWLLGDTVLLAGSRLVSEHIGLAAAISSADMVLTGEGCTDAQSVSGKVPSYVARVANFFEKPCIVISGKLGSGYEQMYRLGVKTLVQATPAGATEVEIGEHAAEWLAEATAATLRDLNSR